MIEDPTGGLGDLGGDGGRRPVAGRAERMFLDVVGIAELQEHTALAIKRLRERREGGDDSPLAQLHWEGAVLPDFSGFSDEKREALEAEIEETRADPEWRADFKRKLEQEEPGLARLMEV